MKKSILLLLLSTLSTLLFVGCNDDNKEPKNFEENLHFITASLPQGTKTALDGFNVTWSKGDEIAVYGSSEDFTVKHKYTLYYGEGKTTAIFCSTEGIEDDQIMAVFPYSQASKYQERRIQFYSVALTQYYQQNNISPNAMSMYALGKSDSLKFTAASSVLRLSVTTDTPKTLNKISLSSAGILQRRFILSPDGSLYRATDGSSSITYSLEKQIGTDTTEFNIAISDGNLKDFQVIFFASDGTVAVKKVSNLNILRNTINEAVTDLTFKKPIVEVSIDGGEWQEWPEAGLQTPTSSIKVRSSQDALLTVDHLDSINSALNRAKTRIDVDLSNIDFYTNTWSNFKFQKYYVSSLFLPNNITIISNGALSCEVDTVIFGSNVTTLRSRICDVAPNLRFKVSSANEYFSNDDAGALYNKDKSILYYAQKGITNYTVLSGVTEIGINAFTYVTSLKTVTIPSSVKTICLFAFYSNSYLDTLYLECTPPTLTYNSTSYTNSIGVSATHRIIKVPASSYSDYISDSRWFNLTQRSNKPYTIIADGVISPSASLGNLSED